MRALHRPSFQSRAAPAPFGWAKLLFVLALAISGATCKRGASPACRQDVDCPAGFDCGGGTCVRRQRMRFGVDAHPASTDRGPAPSDAGQPLDAEAAPAVPPPPAIPPPPSDQPRLPMWKERLKNT